MAGGGGYGEGGGGKGGTRAERGATVVMFRRAVGHLTQGGHLTHRGVGKGVEREVLVHVACLQGNAM